MNSEVGMSGSGKSECGSGKEEDGSGNETIGDCGLKEHRRDLRK